MLDRKPGSLRQVIAVAASVDVPVGGTLYVTAVEIWDYRIVVHAAADLPEFFPPGEPLREHRPMWIISDDVGTAYPPGSGGGSSGTNSYMRSCYEFAATVPATARTLFVLGPGMTDDEPIAVPLPQST